MYHDDSPRPRCRLAPETGKGCARVEETLIIGVDESFGFRPQLKILDGWAQFRLEYQAFSRVSQFAVSHLLPSGLFFSSFFYTRILTHHSVAVPHTFRSCGAGSLCPPCVLLSE